MKKLLALLTVFTLAITLAACGASEVRLPSLAGMDRYEIEERFDELGLDYYFFVDEDTERSRPYMFLRYMNHSSGAMVEAGSRIQIVVSSSLEEEDTSGHYPPAPLTPIDVDGEFTDYEDVALYIDTFKELPNNLEGSEEPFDHLDYDPLPDDESLSFYRVDVSFINEDNDEDEGDLIFTDDGEIIFFSPDNFDSFDHLFGTPEHPPLDEFEFYTSSRDVALYFRTFGRLPINYIIRYENDYTQSGSAFRRAYGDPDDMLFVKEGWTHETYEFFSTPRDARRYFDDYEGINGEAIYFGYWHFSNHSGQMPTHTSYFIADTRIGGFSESRGDHRFVFSPSNNVIYYTSTHFTETTEFELWYGDNRGD